MRRPQESHVTLTSLPYWKHLCLLVTSDQFQVWLQKKKKKEFHNLFTHLSFSECTSKQVLLLWDKRCIFKSLLQTRPKFPPWFLLANADRHVASCCRYNDVLIRTCCWYQKPDLSQSYSGQSQVRLAQAAATLWTGILYGSSSWRGLSSLLSRNI